ncbi:MAG: FGGY-family carbohydrate kinase [Ruthenibacterium lactatiformans]
MRSWRALRSRPRRCAASSTRTIRRLRRGDIPARVREYCAATGQYVPQTVGEVMRCIYEGLALKYRFALGQLEAATGRRFAALHVLGGGAKTAFVPHDSGRYGPAHSSRPGGGPALGNILIQLVALGMLPSIDADGGSLQNRTCDGISARRHAAWDAPMYGMRTCCGAAENRKITKDKERMRCCIRKSGSARSSTAAGAACAKAWRTRP